MNYWALFYAQALIVVFICGVVFGAVSTLKNKNPFKFFWLFPILSVLATQIVLGLL